MDNRIIAPNPNISLANTAPRVTPSPPSATKFGDVLASTAVQSAESAMTVLPGGPMMALAVRGGTASVPIGTTSSALTTSSGTKSPEGPTATSSASTPFGSATGIPGISGTSVTGATGTATDPTSAATGTTGTDPASIQSSLQQSADMNMYMLQVQQQVQQQGQQFTTLSNVMKAQYDTVKNAIGNIR